jgi:hypothetical protein
MKVSRFLKNNSVNCHIYNIHGLCVNSSVKMFLFTTQTKTALWSKEIGPILEDNTTYLKKA